MIYSIQVVLDIQKSKPIPISKHHPGCLPIGMFRIMLPECMVNVLYNDIRVEKQSNSNSFEL